MNPFWFLRMARWARNPPSAARVRLVLAIIAICALIFAIEHFFGWPDWLSVAPVPRGGVRL